MNKYGKAVIIGLLVYGFLLGAFKYWLGFDPMKGYGFVSLVSLYVAVSIGKKFVKK